MLAWCSPESVSPSLHSLHLRVPPSSSGFSPETIWSCWKRGHPGLLWAAGAAGLPLATQRMFPLIYTEHGWPPSVPRLMWFLTVWRWKLLSFPACCLKFFSKACIFWRLGVGVGAGAGGGGARAEGRACALPTRPLSFLWLPGPGTMAYIVRRDNSFLQVHPARESSLSFFHVSCISFHVLPSLCLSPGLSHIPECGSHLMATGRVHTWRPHGWASWRMLFLFLS